MFFQFWGTQCKIKTYWPLHGVHNKHTSLHPSVFVPEYRVSGLLCFLKGDSKENIKYNYLPLKCFLILTTIIRTTSVIILGTHVQRGLQYLVYQSVHASSRTIGFEAANERYQRVFKNENVDTNHSNTTMHAFCAEGLHFCAFHMTL